MVDNEADTRYAMLSRLLLLLLLADTKPVSPFRGREYRFFLPSDAAF